MKRALEHITVAMVLTAILLIVGCTVTKVVEDPPGSGNLKKVAETDPRFTTATDTIGAVNTATSMINPWHGLITIGLGAAAAFADWNRRRKQAQLDAVITGVETSGNAEVKKAIFNAAVAAKVEPGLNDSVKNVTGG